MEFQVYTIGKLLMTRTKVTLDNASDTSRVEDGKQ